MQGYCYFLLCSNQAFYTGWTTNVRRRFQQHCNGKGAYYTKVYPPIALLYWESYANDRIARKRELQLKKMTHQQKEKLYKGSGKPLTNNQYYQDYEYYVSAPGRVNLLGEHVDYNGGPVLPAAIDRSISLWANPDTSDVFSIEALDLNEKVVFSLISCQKKLSLEGNPLPHWALYPASVIQTADQLGLEVHGFDAVFSSTIPIGSGLSSSAAVEVAFAALLRELGNWQLDNLQLAQLCLEAERYYVGVNCGIMDQFASANGIENAALLLNTSSLKWSIVPLDPDVAIIIADSKIERNLASSAYNERRASCEEALAILRKDLPEIKYLSQVSSQELAEYANQMPEIPYKRAKHVVEECERVRNAVDVLEDGNMDEFGKLMRTGHASLRDLYEVSVPELDLMVEIANTIPACFGSRMTGAGFGGCTVSLVSKPDAESFIKRLKKEYQKISGREIDVYACKASNGVSVQWRNHTT